MSEQSVRQDTVAKAVPPATRDSRIKVLSREDAERIMRSLVDNSRGGGDTVVFAGSIWRQTLRWARNEVQVAGDLQQQSVVVARKLQGYMGGSAESNQFDDATLMNMLRTAEYRSRLEFMEDDRNDPFVVDVAQFSIPDAPLWSEATTQVTADARARLVTLLSEKARAAGMMSAGYVEIRIASFANASNVYGTRYSEYTQAESSVTVRNSQGTGSGWAGISGFDWSRFDTVALAERALDKCRTSIDPVRIEPGRYTVVLEPQAVEGLVRVLVDSFSRGSAESGRGPFALQKDDSINLWITKLGMKVTDERVTIAHDPTDPGTAVIPERGMTPITWIDRGILTTLDDGTSITQRVKTSAPGRNANLPAISRPAFRMSGGATTVDEMIRTTKRGLLVTRFWGITKIDQKSLLSTGVTRDGLWLIENGTISKSVNNLRFIESPLFVLNQIDQLGEPTNTFVPTLSGGGAGFLEMMEFITGPRAAVVPPLKVHDFNFAALVDAV